MIAPLELNRIGYKALAKALGFDGMIRFLRQFETGSDDYTQTRHQLLNGFTVDYIFNQIEQQQEQTDDMSDS
ncbi:MAG: hypothetical protein ACFB2W_29120 [Leptolyngbyaceae cyanobacterium]